MTVAAHAAPLPSDSVAATRPPAVELSNVTKIYETASGGRVHALSNINLEVGAGEFVSVLGASGCGKTTMLRIIGGLEGGYDGTLTLHKQDGGNSRGNVGIVFQDANLLPWRSILQNVLLPAKVLRLDKLTSIARAQELIELAGLKGFQDKYPFELSGGMRQRTSIARALVHDPSVLLMDEPFGALDALTREVMNLEVLKIWDATKKTVFMITHSITEAVFMSDRVVVMSPRPGRIIGEIDIALPRPRNTGMLSEERFATYTRTLRRLLMLARPKARTAKVYIMATDARSANNVKAPRRREWLRWGSLFRSDYFVSFAGFAVLACVWEISIRLFKIPDYILPAPSAIGFSLYDGFLSGAFIYNSGVTAFETVMGFLLAAATGIAIGAIVAQFSLIERVVYPWLVAVQTLPKIAIAPLIIIWAGYGIGSKIIIVALVAIFPVLVNTITGLKSCDQGKLDLMQSLGAGRWETFRTVRFPNALPFIFAGLNVAIVLAILGAIVGEFVGSQAGLGNLILEANFQFDVARIFAVLVILAVFGVLLTQLMQLVQNRLLFWNKASS